MVHDHFSAHGIDVVSSKELTGKVMRETRALNSLYPRLAAIAELGKTALTRQELELLNKTFEGHQVIQAEKAVEALDCSAHQLCQEGDRSRVVKLGPGAYAALIECLGFVVLNHFFPEFRERYYAECVAATAFECISRGQGLHDLREKLVGHIDPSCAAEGSLRFLAYSRAEELGLGSVTTARNFFHISPGYLEALAQLAFVFPENGTFPQRLRAAGVRLSEDQEAQCMDSIQYHALFAETETLTWKAALTVLSFRLLHHEN